RWWVPAPAALRCTPWGGFFGARVWVRFPGRGSRLQVEVDHDGGVVGGAFAFAFLAVDVGVGHGRGEGRIGQGQVDAHAAVLGEVEVAVVPERERPGVLEGAGEDVGQPHGGD